MSSGLEEQEVGASPHHRIRCLQAATIRPAGNRVQEGSLTLPSTLDGCPCACRVCRRVLSVYRRGIGRAGGRRRLQGRGTRYVLSNGREAEGWVHGRERGWEREGLQRILGNGCGPSGTPRLTLTLCISLCCSSRCVFAVLNLHMFSRLLVTFLHLGVLHDYCGSLHNVSMVM